jgi:hypothetical protein
MCNLINKKLLLLRIMTDIVLQIIIIWKGVKVTLKLCNSVHYVLNNM